jgi:phosphate-selective porin OprO and OprP
MRNQGIFSRGLIALMFFAVLLPGCIRARAADSEVDRLLAILVQKHLLTQEEAASVRAEVKNDNPMARASAPASEPKPDDTAKESAPQAGPTTTLKNRAQEEIAKLPFRISGYGQVQWASLPGAGSTFQLRRGRVSVDGDVKKLASYKIQVDTVHAPSLLDAYFQLNLHSAAKLTLGQFKVPFSQESLRGANDLLTVERSQVVNSLVPGRDNGSNGRDIGATIGGSYNFTESTGVDYAVGVFNGAGIDRKDDNNRKDVAARLAVRPFQGLAFAGDYYHGASGSSEAVHDRQGAEFAYTHRPVTLLGEYIWGKDGVVRERGWYGLGAWRFAKQWEGVFRVDNYDSNRSRAGLAATTYLGGFNWYFAPGLKWQLNYGLVDKQSHAKSLFLSQMQFQF